MNSKKIQDETMKKYYNMNRQEKVVKEKESAFLEETQDMEQHLLEGFAQKKEDAILEEEIKELEEYFKSITSGEYVAEFKQYCQEKNYVGEVYYEKLCCAIRERLKQKKQDERESREAERASELK